MPSTMIVTIIAVIRRRRNMMPKIKPSIVDVGMLLLFDSNKRQVANYNQLSVV